MATKPKVIKLIEINIKINRNFLKFRHGYKGKLEIKHLFVKYAIQGLWNRVISASKLSENPSESIKSYNNQQIPQKAALFKRTSTATASEKAI